MTDIPFSFDFNETGDTQDDTIYGGSDTQDFDTNLDFEFDSQTQVETQEDFPNDSLFSADFVNDTDTQEYEEGTQETDFDGVTQTQDEGDEADGMKLDFADDDEFNDSTEENIDFNNLPPHACSYCGLSNPDNVVRCDVCNKWFCNGRGVTASAHIITHMIRSKHKRVSLHEKGPVAGEAVECYNCGRKNSFLLGFVRAKVECIVVLLCREPCLNNAYVEDLNWDLDRWQPLMKDRQFLHWLVKEPTKKQALKARAISMKQIMALEELWQTNPNATPDDLNNAEVGAEPDSVLVRYEDSHQYKQIYGALLKLEADYDRKLKESQAQSGIQVRWELGLNGRHNVYFILSRQVECGLKLKLGNELRLSYKGDKLHKPWKSNGQVVDITDLEIQLELASTEKDKDAPTDQTTGFAVDFVWKSTSYDRCLKALNIYCIDDRCITTYLYHRLLGHNVVPENFPKVDLPTEFSAPGIPELNHSQVAAVEHVLQNPLSLIQGPPGTGKTVTSAAVVYHLVNQSAGQVLVVAPSNIAVDQLCHKIHQTGLKVVRLCAKSRERINSHVDFLALHNLVEELATVEENRYHIMKKELGELNAEDERHYKKFVWKTEHELLKSADVVCCTCTGAGDPRLSGFRFTKVLIDESAQATEPECLIPLVKGAKQVVLVGDHYQLGPVIMCKKAAKAGLQRSLFERLILLGNVPIRLQVQYRMHPALSEYPSNTFYEGTLQNGVNSVDREDPLLHDMWPNVQVPMFFYCSTGLEEFAASGTSYVNRIEAQNVERVVNKMFKRGICPNQIGIITPYEGQRSYVLNYMLQAGNATKEQIEELEVASVDAFQGREKDYIILSCVRSNEVFSIGFLNDPRRLNVAITRARQGLIVIGNPQVLAGHPLWNGLLFHMKQHNALVEGPIDNLKLSALRLSRPRKQYQHRSNLQPIPPRRYGDNREFNQQVQSALRDLPYQIPHQVPFPPPFIHPGAIFPRGPPGWMPPVQRPTSSQEMMPNVQSQFDMRSSGDLEHGFSGLSLSGLSGFTQPSQPSQGDQNFDFS